MFKSLKGGLYPHLGINATSDELKMKELEHNDDGNLILKNLNDNNISILINNDNIINSIPYLQYPDRESGYVFNKDIMYTGFIYWGIIYMGKYYKNIIVTNYRSEYEVLRPGTVIIRPTELVDGNIYKGGEIIEKRYSGNKSKFHPSNFYKYTTSSWKNISIHEKLLDYYFKLNNNPILKAKDEDKIDYKTIINSKEHTLLLSGLSYDKKDKNGNIIQNLNWKVKSGRINTIFSDILFESEYLNETLQFISNIKIIEFFIIIFSYDWYIIDRDFLFNGQVSFNKPEGEYISQPNKEFLLKTEISQFFDNNEIVDNIISDITSKNEYKDHFYKSILEIIIENSDDERNKNSFIFLIKRIIIISNIISVNMLNQIKSDDRKNISFLNNKYNDLFNKTYTEFKSLINDDDFDFFISSLRELLNLLVNLMNNEEQQTIDKKLIIKRIFNKFDFLSREFYTINEDEVINKLNILLNNKVEENIKDFNKYNNILFQSNQGVFFNIKGNVNVEYNNGNMMLNNIIDNKIIQHNNEEDINGGLDEFAFIMPNNNMIPQINIKHIMHIFNSDPYKTSEPYGVVDSVADNHCYYIKKPNIIDSSKLQFDINNKTVLYQIDPFFFGLTKLYSYLLNETLSLSSEDNNYDSLMNNRLCNINVKELILLFPNLINIIENNISKVKNKDRGLLHTEQKYILFKKYLNNHFFIKMFENDEISTERLKVSVSNILDNNELYWSELILIYIDLIYSYQDIFLGNKGNISFNVGGSIVGSREIRNEYMLPILTLIFSTITHHIIESNDIKVKQVNYIESITEAIENITIEGDTVDYKCVIFRVNYINVNDEEKTYDFKFYTRINVLNNFKPFENSTKLKLSDNNYFTYDIHHGESCDIKLRMRIGYGEKKNKYMKNIVEIQHNENEYLTKYQIKNDFYKKKYLKYKTKYFELKKNLYEF